jgi:translation initiation factor 3 subunit A
LTACKVIAPLVDSISKDEDYAPYIRALKPVVLARLLQSLSEVYSTISISYVMGLVKPFASGPWATNEKDLETFLMGASQRGELGVAVDHISKAITFQHEQAVKPVVLSEVSNLQDIAATGQTSQIARLALALQNTIQYLNPSVLEDAKQARAKAFARALAEAEDERKAAVHRQAIVDRRRQKLEEINSRRQREENDAKVARAREAAVEAAAREAEAYKQREKDRVQKEIDTIRNAEAKKLAETLKARGGLKVDLDGVEDLDTEKLLQLQSAQIAKEQKNIAERMRIISKRVDHLERAFRKEERPLLEDDYEKQKQADKDAHKAAIKAAQQAALEKHHLDLALKERLSRMLGDYQSAKQIIESARQEEFAQRKAEADKKIAEEKKAYRAQVLKERAERRRKEEQERQAREQAEREEEGEFGLARLDIGLVTDELLFLVAAERAAAEAEAKAAAAAKAEADAAAAAERRAAREAERQKDIEAARKRVEEEEERERRRAERAREGPVRSAPAPAASSSAPGAEGGRRRLQLAPRTQPVPAQAAATPTPAAAAAAAAPARTEPATAAPPAARAPPAAGSWAARREAATPAASTPAPPVFKAGAGGGWREREAARKAAGGDAASDAPPASTGGYRPPGARR